MTTPESRPPPPPDSLMAAYERWRQAQATKATDPVAKAAEATPADIEARAWKKSRRRVVKRIGKGKPPTAALAAGYRRYRALGGRMTVTAWHRKLADGR